MGFLGGFGFCWKPLGDFGSTQKAKLKWRTISHPASLPALRAVRVLPPEDLWVTTAGHLFPNRSVVENIPPRRYMKLNFTRSKEELEVIKVG